MDKGGKERPSSHGNKSQDLGNGLLPRDHCKKESPTRVMASEMGRQCRIKGAFKLDNRQGKLHSMQYKDKTARDQQ